MSNMIQIIPFALGSAIGGYEIRVCPPPLNQQETEKLERQQYVKKGWVF